MADKRTITPEEKALLQAKHRQEEAEARNRKKERDARTHRLVQEGAILESIVPHIKEMDLDFLKRELMIRLRGPIGANKSTTRADKLSLYPLHNLNFSSGKSGVR